ncbi:transcriptional regulator [Prevotella sp. CAG:604]|nr:transcriptional regulator [Prevotella sp. CAG:604]
MKGLSNSMVKMIRFIELYLCPQYCGVIDRRRVIAYLFFTLIEAVVIPLHFFLFLIFWEPMGFALTCAHLIVFSVLQWTIWKQRLSFDNGLSALLMLAAGKLMIDSIFCVFLELSKTISRFWVMSSS